MRSGPFLHPYGTAGRITNPEEKKQEYRRHIGFTSIV
jgi:hypothetical protein